MKLIPAIPVAGLRRAVTVIATVLSAAVMNSVSVQAATYIWTSANSDGYTNQLEWSPNGLPGISDTAIIGDVTQPNGSVVYTNVPPDPASTNRLSLLEMGTNSGTSTFEMSGGVLLITNSSGTAFSLGNGSGALDTFTQSGGTLVVARPSTANLYYQDAFLPGDAAGGNGVFTINNGILMILCGCEVGTAGSGTFNLNGGTVIDNGWFGLRGIGTSSDSGVLNMTGGSLYVLRNTEIESQAFKPLSLGQAGTGSSTANISGGTAYLESITFANYAVDETLNMSGGTLYIGVYGVQSKGTVAGTSQNINISGGTFHTADMQIISTTANCGNTNTILADGTNWSWPSPPVNLTNGTFTVNGISGPGYVTFAPEATRTITLDNQWSGVGGMTITGPGTTAIGATNVLDFTGPLNVNSGTLSINSSNAFGAGFAGPLTINGGVTLLTAGNIYSDSLVVNGGTLALAATLNDTSGLTVDSGSVAILNGGSVADPTLNLAAGSSLIFTNNSALTFTNIVAGAGNVQVVGAGTVNVGSNLQNSGTISQNNGVLMVNGSILNASLLTNSSPATVGPLAAQGTIMAPIGIGTNSSMEAGTTIVPGTLAASNVVLNGTLIEKINTVTTVGGGVNDLLICSNLTLNPSSALIIEPLTAPSVGNYVIVKYTGTLTGLFGAVTNDADAGISVNYNTPGEIILNVSSVTQASLVWAATNFSTNINWDVNISSNWTNTATSTLSTFHQLDSVTFNAVPGSGITNRVSVTGQVSPSSIEISGGLPYLFSGFGYISGGTGINYDDTNTSGIYTSGNNFTGPVNINNGILQLGNGGSSWLGTTNGGTYVNGGTLDLNGQAVGAEPLVIQGAGSPLAGTNGGAINNSSTTEPSQSGGPLNITLAGDTTLNASGNRWDIGPTILGAGGGSFAGNGHNLTKIGNQAIWMHETGDIGVGNIDIQQGLLGFEFTIGMGLPSSTVTVEPGAVLGFYQLSSNSILNKTMILNGNATLESGGAAGSSNNFAGPITLNGTNSIQTSIFPLNLLGNITGSGGFTLSGTGPLYLGGDDTYSGSTIMAANSVLALESGASIPNTPLIYMTPGTNTVINASGVGSMTLNNGQTLQGSGSLIGNVTANSGSTIFAGTNVTTFGTIIFTNNLTLNGNTNYVKISDNFNVGVDNDLLSVNQNATLTSPTFVVTPLAGLNSANSYVLVEASAVSGNAQIISVNPRYTMTPSIGTDLNGRQALLLNVAGNAGALEWQGYLSPNWDMVTSNWYNLGSGLHDVFYTGDNPIFDDNAPITGVTVSANRIVSGMTMNNVAKTYTFSGGGSIYGPLNLEGNGSAGGTTILAMSNAPAFTSIDASQGTVVFDLQGMTNYIVPSALSDSNGFGTGTIIFGGTNTARLTGNSVSAPVVSGTYNPDFDGIIMVTNGILQYANVDALGVDAAVNSSPSFSPLIITNNGTLDFDGVAAGTANAAPYGGEKWIHISGNGFNGQGALTDSGNNGEPNGAFCNLYFDGNATIGIPGTRCDQHVLSGNAEQIEGNGYNLTFFGGGALFIYAQADGDTHLGNIDVACTNGGRLAFQGGPVALGTTTDFLTVEPGGEVTFYNFSNILDTVHFGVQKYIWLKGNAAIDSAGASGSESNNFDGPIFLTGTNLIGTRYSMHVWSSIMDSNSPGGFILGNDSVGSSGSALWLDGTNTYSGPTIVSNETLHVGANSSLGLSTYVQVNSGATLDLSATPAYNFGTVQTNQTMAGNGTVVGPATGNLDFNAGGALAIGLPTTNGAPNTNTFTLSISNNVVFNAGSMDYLVANKSSAAAGAVPVDKLAGPKSLTLGGTVVITNYGGKPYVAGDSLALFSATAISTNSGFNILPVTPGPNLAWNITSIPVNGTLSVVSTVTVNPNPTNILFSVSGGNQLTLRWPADHTGWELEIQTNSVSIGISNNWVAYPASTNVDSISIPINLSNGTVFYRLVYPPQ